ncbi:hypothetical protein [Anaerolentibacter hominis]|uniref:hypothetical protein n=1 Tax=Anaerolentibacter hominis TaxID=3079009 RepID=UPI0031B819E4
MSEWKECPNCHSRVSAGINRCYTCGYDFQTGEVPNQKRSKMAEYLMPSEVKDREQPKEEDRPKSYKSPAFISSKGENKIPRGRRQVLIEWGLTILAVILFFVHKENYFLELYRQGGAGALALEVFYFVVFYGIILFYFLYCYRRVEKVASLSIALISLAGGLRALSLFATIVLDVQGKAGFIIPFMWG